ncbi:MAG: hypothetical protein KAU20_00725 [Nanoarchaeota archaeon]|nr:hypothetical protein [Nanoarchaeota archaeon]
MKFVKSDTIKFKILKELYKHQKEITFYALTQSVNVKSTSVLPNCAFLELFEYVKVRSEPAPNGSVFRYVVLTDKGRKEYERIKDKKEIK